MPHVFVYGTLRAGEPNACYLRRAAHRGAALTDSCFTLVDTGAYPAALDYGVTAIAGDVYAVGADTFAELDALEGYPIFYTRRRIATSIGPAWIYLWAATRKPCWPVIESGNWPFYRHNRALRGGDCK